MIRLLNEDSEKKLHSIITKEFGENIYNVVGNIINVLINLRLLYDENKDEILFERFLKNIKKENRKKKLRYWIKKY